MKKQLISFLLALTMILCMAEPALAATFPDVPEDDWSYAYVEEAVALGLIKGRGDGTFDPTGEVTWAEFAPMTARLLYPEETAALPATVPWYEGPFDLLREKGVSDRVDLMGGFYYYNGFESPGEVMCRAEMASFIINALSAASYQLPTQEQINSVWFPDLEEMLMYDLDDIRSVYALGIINGTGDGSFAGDDTMTRAQAAKVLIMMSRLDKTAAPGTPEMPDTPDVPDEPNTDQQSLTPESLYSAMIAMKAQYPEGMPWTNANEYVWYAIPNTIYTGGGCVAFAFILSDAAFGDLPAREISPVRFEDVRVGDILRMENDTHSVIVLEKHENSVIIAEGNYNSSIHWGRELSREAVESADYMYTRYPN